MLKLTALLCVFAAAGLGSPVAPRADPTTLVAPRADPPTPVSYRLPGNVVPSAYTVTIDVTKTFKDMKDNEDKEGNEEIEYTFTGEVQITAKVLKNTNTIRLHAKGMTNLASTVTKNGADLGHKLNLDQNPKYDFLDLKMNKELNAGDEVEIKITYTAQLGNDMHGFYLSKYADKEGKPHYVATTQFQPTHARRAFPCFDEPEFKATFNIIIKRPTKLYKSISNMELKGDPDLKFRTDEVTVDTFRETPRMSTYLVAFIVSEFEANKKETEEKFKVWSRPEAKPQTQTAVDVGMPIIESLRKFTDIDYFTPTVTKMDMAALPDFSAGAMENWGLLTYRETALLVDDAVSTNRDVQRVVSVVAHEVAHQWFGNLVTLNWWNSTWLNEGFARYFEYHTTGAVKPDWEMAEQFLVEQQQVVFGVDALKKTTPLTNPVETPDEISSHFGSISYNKGGSVIRMMEHFLGTETFQKGLQRYLKANKFRNTMPADLWRSLDEQAVADKVKLDSSVQKIMTTWTENPGYPVVTVSLVNDDFVSFKQERFFLSSDDKDKDNSNLWYVPISYTTSKDHNYKDTKPKLWLTPSEPEKFVKISDLDWLLVNIRGTGYYRVNYDTKLWERIIEGLKTKEQREKVDRLNRAQLVDDAFNLARADQLDYKITFDLLDYLASEDDYYPWYAAFQGFRFLLQRFGEADEIGQDLRVHLIDLMTESLLEGQSFADVKNEKQVSVFNRVSALDWACNLGSDKCLDEAKDLFAKSQKEGTIPKNVKSIVYCTALREGNQKDWDYLWNKFEKSNVAAEKVAIINVLGCSNVEKTLKDYLEKSLDSTMIRQQDAQYAFTSVYTSNAKGVDIAFEFLQKRYKDIAKSYGGMNSLGNAMIGLAARLNTDKQIQDFEKFLTEHGDDLMDAKVVGDAAIEKAKESASWAKKNKDVIGDVLKRKRNSSSALTGNSSLLLAMGLYALYVTIFGKH